MIVVTKVMLALYRNYMQTKNPNVSPEMTKFGLFVFGGQGWIRTTEVVDGRFTVCSLWPLGNLPILTFLNKKALELVDGLEPPTC